MSVARAYVGYRFKKIKDMLPEAHIKPDFLPRVRLELFETFRMFWEDSGREYLVTF